MNVNVDVRIGKVTDVNKKKRLVRVKGSPPHRRGKVHLSLTLSHDTLHALTQFFNRVAFVDKLQNRSE